MQQNVNSTFSKDIRRISNIPRFDKKQIDAISTLKLDSEIYNLVKNLKKHRHTSAFNRKTVTSEKLVKNNLLLALKQARHYFEVTGARRLGKCTLDDLVQEAIVGLTKASHKYIETKDGEYAEYGFGHYAKLYINKYVMEFINHDCNPVKITSAEAHQGVLNDKKFYSLNATFDNGKDSMQSPIFNELTEDLTQDQIFELKNKIEIRDEINEKLFKNLNDEEKSIIFMFFGFNEDQSLTVPAIAKRLKRPKKYVISIYEDAVEKIKDSEVTNEDIQLYKTVCDVRISKKEFARAFEDKIETGWEKEEIIEITQNTQLVNKLSNYIDNKFLSSLLNKNLESYSNISKNRTERSKTICAEELLLLENTNKSKKQNKVCK